MSTFFDTSVLLAGLIDFGPQSAPAQSILHAIAEKTIPGPTTAWHGCLEFYSVSSRLGATVIVTDNRRHFLSALRYGIRVETPAESVASMKRRR